MRRVIGKLTSTSAISRLVRPQTALTKHSRALFSSESVEQDLPTVFGTAQFELKFSVRAKYNVTKEDSYVKVKDSVKVAKFDIHSKYHKPLEELKKNQAAYERAKKLYEGPLVSRGFVKYFDQLEEKFPWVLDNLIRNDGEYVDSDNSANPGVQLGFERFEADQQNTKATLTVTDVSTLFDVLGDETSEEGVDARLEAFDKFAKIVGPRYNPIEDIVTMSCEDFDRSEGNRRMVVDQFFKAYHAAIGEEKTQELKTIFKNSADKSGERYSRQVEETKVSMFGEADVPNGTSQLEKVEEFIEKSKKLAEELQAKEPARTKKIEAAAQASLKAWK